MSLLSLMPGMSTWGGMMQAPATTGPAKGPLPASSTPAQVQSCLQAWLWARMGLNMDKESNTSLGNEHVTGWCWLQDCVQQRFQNQ